MPIIQLGEAAVYHEDTGGDLPPIVFSHGLLFSGKMYAAHVEHLRGRYRCITYDHRGQGQSPPSLRPYDMESLYGDAAALIQKLNVGPCHFVGLSMGGFVGMRLAARRPELLRSLVLIDTAADAEPPLNIPKYRLMALAARFVGFGALAPSIMKIVCAASFRNNPQRAADGRRIFEHLSSLRYPTTRAALEAVVTRRPIEAELSRIRTPTLILHGDEDTAIVPHRARPMAQLIPNARYLEIPRAGHTSTMEEPAAINAALDDFLKSVG